MNLLWGFDFSPAKNSSGQDIEPDVCNYAKVRSMYLSVILEMLADITLGYPHLTEFVRMHYHTEESRARGDDQATICYLHRCIPSVRA